MSLRLNLSPERLALLDSRLRAEGVQRGPRLTVERRSDPARPVLLTPQQRQMWILDQIVGEVSPYVILGGLRIDGPLDVELFTRACRAMAQRHESLRTVFRDFGDGPRQVVLDNLEPRVTVSEVAGDPVEAIRRRQDDMALEPFDLANGSLLRVDVLRFGPGDHGVIFGMHHIVSDMWSIGVLMREVMQIYGGLVRGSAPLTPLTIDYPDFALWQAAREGEDEAADIAYWTEKLAGADPETGLVGDRPRPAEKSYRGQSVPITIPAPVAAGVTALAKELGCTRFMVLAAAFATFLVRVGQNDEVVVGTPVAGRPLPELEGLIGCFVNTVALRLDAADDPTFGELVKRTASTALEAFAHDRTPFEKIVQSLAPGRSLSRNPLFQAMFSFQNAPLPQWDYGDLRIHPLGVEALTAKFDIQLDLIEDGDALWGRLVYSADLFDEARGALLAEQLNRVLRIAVANPGQRVSEIDVLDLAWRRRILAWGDGGEPQTPDVGNVYELVARAAQRQPDAVAVATHSGDTTYAELLGNADRLAARLAAAGVSAGDVVGLTYETDERFLTTMLACWRLGAAYLPLDPGWPDERIAFMLQDCGASVVVGEREPGGFVLLAADKAGEDPAQPPAVDTDPGRTAYVIFTSGTTGRPKGVAIAQRALLHYARNVPPRLGWGRPGESYALLQQAYTDFALTTLVTSLTTGGTLRVLGRTEATDPAVVAAALNAVDHAKLVPSHLMAIVATAGPEAVWPRRSLVLGGEGIAVDDLVRLCTERHGRQLVNHYGPTETTIGALTGPVDDADVARGTLALGRPVPGMRAFVLDAAGRLVPPGVIGELHLAGTQVAEGYVNREELTAERFVPDPFGPAGTVMYRTGDRVWWDMDGRIRFLGRVDHQVKIRGYRIEPAEVEMAILAAPRVTACCVCARSDESSARLVAYVTGEPGAEPLTRREVLDAVAQRLPEHMVPTDVVVLDAMPLQSTGKIDRAALPWPVATVDDTASVVAPDAPDELAMAEAFEAVLGRPVRDAHATFFDLGGDSIKAIHLVSAAREAGFELTTRDVFLHQSVAALAAASPRSEVRVAVHDPGTGVVPTWPVLARMRSAGTLLTGYTHRVLLRLPVATRPADLQRALDAVVAHHRILAARLETDREDWRLVVPDEPAAAKLVVVDAEGLPDDAVDRLVTAHVGAVNSILDPREGRNVAAVLLNRGSGERPLLAVVVHHLVVDAVSWGIVLGDLRRAWQRIAAGGPGELPAVPVSMHTWAQAVVDLTDSDEVRDRAGFWREVGAGTTAVLPVADVSAPTREIVQHVDSRLSARLLDTTAVEFGVGVDELCLTAMGIALAETFEPGVAEADVLVEVEGHGRDVAGADTVRTVGWLTEIHPVRVPVRAGATQSAVTLADTVRTTVGAVRAVSEVGWTYGVLRYLDPAGQELLGAPDPQIVYNHLGWVGQRSGDGDWEVDTGRAAALRDPAHGLAPRLTRALNLNTRVEGDASAPRLVAEWTWPEGAVSDETVAAVTRAWQETLARLADVAESGTGDIRLTPRHSGGRITRVPRRRPMPLSFPQLNNVLQPAGLDNPHHNVVVATVLQAAPDAPGATVDVEALRRALVEVVRRHEVLRTRVMEIDGEWRQLVVEEPAWPLRVVDASGAENAWSVVTEVIADEQRVGFTMADGRPVRSALVHVGDGRHVLVMVLHHIVIDPWGYSQLQRDLATAYQKAIAGEDPRLAALPVSYLDFAVWQQDRLATGELDEQVNYWRETLRDLPAPPTFSAPEHQLGRPVDGYTQGFVLSESVTRDVHEVSRRLGVTPFMFLLAAFDTLHACYSGSDDLSVTVPLAGRDQPETQSMVGYFINEIVVRVRLDWRNSFADVARLVRDSFLQGQANQEAPLRLLFGGQQQLDPMRTMFNLVNYEPFALDLGPLVSSPLSDVGSDNDEAIIPEVITAMQPFNLDFYLAMHERDGVLNGIWLFSPEVVDRDVMGAMTEAFPRLVSMAVADPEMTLTALRDAVLARMSEEDR
ncbi:non-ribosomal peptide synthetase [Micromonospora sp. CP22]|uniref:non-ribosomal peptide synthetase n=1 Tax=Micromonospora sp. CP22 TaxID=2580517 RepID=UPI0012BB678E|nr:non-ribosomal peptide synthetase [Micromonospora sp. CP22]MTK01202.1 amino acid adenylation domain-containing protein [Micromonospora sp. CP22]